MNNPLRTPEDYELFLYTLTEQFSSVRSSTLFFVRRDATQARIIGELQFEHGIRIKIHERVLYHDLPMTIYWYGYDVWRAEEKLYSYDSQPHPNDSSLVSTHPHHKHVPPNIKHNRIPAPQMSFTRPNLIELIQEIEQLIALQSTIYHVKYH